MMKRFGLICFLCFKLLFFYAQEKNVFVSAKKVAVGEPLTVKFEISYDKRSSFKFSFPDSIFPCNKLSSSGNLIGEPFPHLEIVFKNDTLVTKGDVFLRTMTIKLVSWEPGTLILQPLTYELDNVKNSFSSVLVECYLENEKPNLPLNDIKERFNRIESEGTKPSLWWIILPISLLVLAVVFWCVRNSKNKVKRKKASDTNIKSQALMNLAALKNKKLWESDQKKHVTELSFLVRWYLSVNFQLNLLERTSNETVILLKQYGLDRSCLTKLSAILTQCDAIKFADARINNEQHLKLLDLAEELIQLTYFESNNG
ncbi:MAG: hypothetical protein EBS34_09015 [Flavobacteriales bacterium]|nr:hypothetical protein [Flavobacteriales bacterium]